MSKLREAAQAVVNTFVGDGYSPALIKAIWALRDALAAPEEDGSLLEAAVLAEREACAEICDRLERRYGNGPEVEHWAQGFKKGASVSAAKIRARGKK